MRDRPIPHLAELSGAGAAIQKGQQLSGIAELYGLPAIPTLAPHTVEPERPFNPVSSLPADVVAALRAYYKIA
jgi:hypothetical protein